MRRTMICGPLVALMLSLGGTGASAHAFLVRAVPPVGGTVAAAPAEIRITFSEAVEPAFSRIELTTANGQTIKTGAAVIDPQDHTQFVLRLPRLAPGRYRVKWRAVAVDTHVTQGNYAFVIKP